MAKLSARDRSVVHEVIIEKDTPNDDLTSHSKTIRRLMSDHTILEKRQVTWKNPGYGSDKHDWGWKVKGKLVGGTTPQEWLEDKLSKGWKKGNGNGKEI